MVFFGGDSSRGKKASLVAQMVENLPAMQKTPVGFLGWEDTLEEGMATYPSNLAWRILMDRGTCLGCSPWGHKELDTHTYTHLEEQRAALPG